MEGRYEFDSAGGHPYITVQHSNTELKNVTTRPQSKVIRPRSMFARGLSFLLLGFIVYGTTVEAAHRHGKFSESRSPQSTACVSDSGMETQSGGNLTSCADCLICQLHQYFSATLISVPPSIGLSAVKARFSSLDFVSVSSETNAPRRGRAPPFSL
jgi:hypothetical protein